MRDNHLRSVLAAGETAVCGWLASGSPHIAEQLSHSGYDAVVIDLQHGMFGTDALPLLLQAVSTGPATPLVRVAGTDAEVIGKALDAGAYGIICASVDTAEQAAAFVRACRYPPSGERSYGASRGVLYGGPDYMERADDTIMTWAMAESATALDNLDAIVATPHLDGIFVGPNDLALSLGETPGQTTFPPATARALEQVAKVSRAAGRLTGVFAIDADGARRLAGQGYTMVVPGNDVGILAAGVAQRLQLVRRGDVSGGWS